VDRGVRARSAPNAGLSCSNVIDCGTVTELCFAKYLAIPFNKS